MRALRSVWRFRHPPLTVFTLGLVLAAGMALPAETAPAEEPGRTLAALAVGETLKAADYLTALAGHLLTSTTPNGVRIEMRHGVDGNSTMRSFRTDPPTVILGRWEAKDGQFCTTWENYRDGKTLCGVVIKAAADQVRIEYTTGGSSLMTVKD
ncbi:MAG: hypothetical protein OEW39_05295 [Deltaproteobacteria bacterium]|nr:hypothetical protein [Deltaproteobacteria bacterium]